MNDKQFFHYEGHSDIPEEQPLKKQKRLNVIMITVIVVCLLIIIPASAYAGAMIAKKYYSNPKTTVVYVTDETDSSVSTNSIKDICNAVLPSVVEVKTSTRIVERGTQSISNKSGSGIVWSKDGYIVTSYQTVREAREINVVLDTDEVVAAEFRAYDEKYDLAILFVKCDTLKSVTLGINDSVSYGKEVIAIGNQSGASGIAITNGFVCAPTKNITIENKTMPLFQTNATLSPESNGGGLFSMNGSLIGLITLSDAFNIGNNGISYALPVNELKSVVEELITNGYVKGRVDSSVVTLQSYVDALGNRQVKVTAVNSQNIGLKVGDLIVSVKGININSAMDWDNVLISCDVGESVKISYARSGEKAEISYMLEEKTSTK